VHPDADEECSDDTDVVTATSVGRSQLRRTTAVLARIPEACSVRAQHDPVVCWWWLWSPWSQQGRAGAGPDAGKLSKIADCESARILAENESADYADFADYRVLNRRNLRNLRIGTLRNPSQSTQIFGFSKKKKIADYADFAITGC
jgi:hypothetical protein